MKLEDIGFLEVLDSRIDNFARGKISYAEWIITGACNFSCPYCNKLEVEETDYKYVIDNLHSMQCKYLHITGGEPTVKHNLVEIISYAKSKGIRVGISTNGSKSLDYYKELIKAGIELFSISLDVHQKEMNSKFCNVHGVFDLVASNIKGLSKLSYVTVGTVLNEDNIDYCNKIFNYISGLGAADIRIGTATQYNKMVKFNLSKYLLNRHKILKYRVENYNNGLNMRGSNLCKSNKCYLVLDDLTIKGKEYYPCAVYAREGGKPIGIFGPENEVERLKWFQNHDSHMDPICKKYCMDFKCRFNEKAAEKLEKEITL